MIFDFVYYYLKLYLCILNNFLIYEIYSCKWRITKALNVVSGVISSSQSRPILENFLFELESEILQKLTGF